MNRNLRTTLATLFTLLLLAEVLFSACSRQVSAYEQSILEQRETKDQYLRNSPETPIPEHIRLAFKGLAYHPVDHKWKVRAQFIPMDSAAAKYELATDAEKLLAGVLLFRLDGKDCRLLAFWREPGNDSELFVPFHDGTRGKGSYPGGRYLNVNLSKSDSVTLDFNRAYNPLCAYNPLTVCPLPPAENRLEIAVKAGEMEFPLKDLN